jgi:hypothetical protein
MGTLLILPFIAWSITGMIFFIKPGYGDAYAMLSPRFYPPETTYTITPAEDWQSFRLVRTLLGDHLLVRKTDGAGLHLDPATLENRAPQTEDLESLLEDAIANQKERYGTIDSLEDNTAKTSTGIKLSLDWTSLSMAQYGSDTRLIDSLYRMHYLQWTGIKSVDRVLGMVGLVLLVLMTISGAWLLLKGKRNGQ